MPTCLVALGSNQGDRVQTLVAAIGKLRERQGVHFLRASSLVETAPVGGPPGQGKYLNAAAVIQTTLDPRDLLAALQSIETEFGRVRQSAWGPRTLDLDLLLYGDAVIERPGLAVPHPRMSERRFVLAPAAEIAGDWRHPGTQRTIAEMLAALPPPALGEMGLRVFTSPAAMQSTVQHLREQGRRVALVPTMGALHDGHLSLVRIARERADVVAASIFVNPTQFGPQEDFRQYPRPLEADLQMLSAAGCDLVFIPTAADMYPPNFSTYVEPPVVAQPLEGVCRPGHFRGVATIVLKLFHLIPAHLACFGQKDYQQLLVIRHMVNDLALPIELVSCPTVREADGLAMSSRNQYLSPAQRRQAVALSRALGRANEMVAAGERNAARLVTTMRETLAQAEIQRVDYVAIAEAETLAEKQSLDCPAVALIAAFVGDTRLIDNCLLNVS